MAARNHGAKKSRLPEALLGAMISRDYFFLMVYLRPRSTEKANEALLVVWRKPQTYTFSVKKGLS